MKRLPILLVLILSFVYAYSSEITLKRPGDSIEIKKWTKEDFIKEFGINDSAKALINLFFTKNKRGRNQAIIGGAFLIGGVTTLVIPPEPGDDQKGFRDMVRPVAEPGATALGAILTASGIIKLGRYTKQKLFILLSNYKNGSPVPKEYKKKLKWKYFPLHVPPNPRF
jgi:hypothetical protein